LMRFDEQEGHLHSIEWLHFKKAAHYAHVKIFFKLPALHV
jgi:hypothetical protein